MSGELNEYYTITKEIHSILGFLTALSIFALILSVLFLFFSNKSFHTLRKLSKITLILTHSQILMGVLIWFLSPLVKSFLQTPKIGLKIKEIRFFSLEHPLMMLFVFILVMVLNKAIKKGHRKAAISYIILLLGILIYAIPFERLIKW